MSRHSECHAMRCDTNRWKWTQTFEITVRHNRAMPLEAVDVALATKHIPVDVSEANFAVKEVAERKTP